MNNDKVKDKDEQKDRRDDLVSRANEEIIAAIKWAQQFEQLRQRQKQNSQYEEDSDQEQPHGSNVGKHQEYSPQPDKNDVVPRKTMQGDD